MVDRYGRPNGHIYRAKMIARTETMYAQNESAMATYEASDAVAQGEIVDNQTGFGDADCMARNGYIGSLDDVRRHLAEEHPQGTARVLPILKDDPNPSPQEPLRKEPEPSPTAKPARKPARSRKPAETDDNEPFETFPGGWEPGHAVPGATS